MVVVITSAGEVAKRRFAFAEPVDPGLVEWARRVPERAGRPGSGSRSRLLARALRRAEPRAARAAFLPIIRARRSTSLEDERELYVGGAAGAARRAPRRGDRRLPQPASTRSRSAPRCSTCSRSSLDRAGRSSASATSSRSPGCTSLALVGATYGLREPAARRGQPARAAADGLREGDPLGPGGGARALALRRRGLRRRVAGARGGRRHRCWHDVRPCRPPNATTTSCSASRATRDEQRDQEGVPRARARAAPRRLRATPTPRSASARSPRPTRCSRTPRRAQLYDRYGHAGLRSGGFQPTHFDFGNLADLFSAFFGDDLFGAAARGRARGADVVAEVEIELAEAASGMTRRRSRSRSPSPARPASGDGVAARHDVVDLPALRRHAAGCSRSRAASSASSSARRRARDCGGSGPQDRAAVRDVRRRRPHARGADARGRDPGRHPRRPADPPLRRGPRRRARRPRGRPLRPGARPARRALRARGQRHLLAGRPHDRPGRARRDASTVATLDGEVELEFEPRHAARRGARAARQGHARAAGLRPRRPARRSSTSSCRAGSRDEQRRLLEEFERLSDDETYRPDEGFFEKLKSAFR